MKHFVGPSWHAHDTLIVVRERRPWPPPAARPRPRVLVADKHGTYSGGVILLYCSYYVVIT